MNAEKLSILMPVYNRSQFILSALETVLNQTYPNFQIIIYDDGSTDNTCELIESLNDDRIVLVKGSVNKGVGFARNVLLDICDTKYAMWMDSDDYSNIHRLQVQYDNMLKYHQPLVFCGFCWIHKLRDGSSNWQQKPSRLKKANKGFATLFFKVDKTIRFDPDKKLGGEDLEWLDKMESKYGVGLLLRERMYYIRWHADRIGAWKRKMPELKGSELEKKLSYQELLDYHRKQRRNKR